MSSALRLHVNLPLTSGVQLDLPASVVRHVQVRRLQPGDPLQLFDGRGHEWAARLLSMGRSHAAVEVIEPLAARPELVCAVTLALGVPANERMDTLVEKATELGVAAIQPLMTERSVLRLSGERAERKQAHWQAIAAAACEQCGRARVPQVAPILGLAPWLQSLAATDVSTRWLLSPDPAAPPLRELAPSASGLSPRVLSLSGPEGGLSVAEEAAARAAGFASLNLGHRVLRADTAPLALMAWISLLA